MASAVERLTAKAVLNPLHWAKRWTPNAVPAKYAPFHRQLVELPAPGHAQARAVFRGAAKTTLSRTTIAWAAEHRKVRGVVLVRATGSECKADRQALERVARRRGMPYAVDHELRLIVLNEVPVWTVTPGGSVRGIQWTNPRSGEVVRPNLAVIDDLETRESARSSYQTGTIETWLFSDLLATADQEHPMSVIMWGTPITPTCLMAKAMRQEAPFHLWDAPLVVPILDGDDPAWPATFRPELLEQVPELTLATEYMLQPLPPGTLVFPGEHTVWRFQEPDRRWPMIIGVDPSGDGEDHTAAIATALIPQGLYVADVLDWTGKMDAGPVKVAEFIDRQVAAGWNVRGATIEAVGAWKFFTRDVRLHLESGVRVTSETPGKSKLERVLPATLWHQKGALSLNPALKGSQLDLELHSFTQEEQTVTGHDDAVDAFAWSAAPLTQGWKLPVPQAA